MANKIYDVEVAFQPARFSVIAANKREATRKIKEKLKTIPAYKYFWKEDMFVDER